MQDLERFETKFLLSMQTALEIERRLRRYISLDHYSGENGYRVRSVYFDTIYNKDFNQRAESLTYRRHLRLRIYPDQPDRIALELKERNGVTVRKRMLTVSEEEARSVLGGDYECLKWNRDAFGRLLYRIMTMDVYRPCVMIEYRRRAYARQENNIRITFDSFIRSTECDFDLFHVPSALTPVGPQGEVTMELKYTDFFMSDLKTAIGSEILRPEPAGKYQRARMIAKSGRNIL